MVLMKVIKKEQSMKFVKNYFYNEGFEYKYYIYMYQ